MYIYVYVCVYIYGFRLIIIPDRHFYLREYVNLDKMIEILRWVGLYLVSNVWNTGINVKRTKKNYVW